MPNYSNSNYNRGGSNARRSSSAGVPSSVRRSRKRRRGKRNLDILKLAGILLVTVLIVFGTVKISDALRKPAEPDYYLPTKITEAPEDPAPAQPMIVDADTGSDDGQDGQSVSVQEETPAPQEPSVAEAPEPTEETPTYVPDDSGYFPEQDDSGTAPESTVTDTGSSGPRRATIRFAGDIVADTEILNTAYVEETGKHDFSRYFSMISDQLSNADFTVLNVDGSMGGKKFYKYGYSGYPQFNTPPQMLYALIDSGVDCLSLANNHCLDGWYDGLKQTILNCEKVNMKHFGAYASQEAYDTPEIFEVNGIKIGMLDYTQSLNSMDTAGVDKNALIYGVRRTKGADYAGDISKLRKAGAEVVIVYIHWGTEYLLSPDDNQVAMAKQIVAAGADVIIGGHPHTPQKAGWTKATMESGETNRCLLVYSLGNFLSEHRNENMPKTDSGYIFEFTLQEDPATGRIDVVEPKYIPIAVWRVGSKGSYDYRVVSVDAVLADRPSGMNDETFARMREISAEMDALIDGSVIERIAY